MGFFFSTVGLVCNAQTSPTFLGDPKTKTAVTCEETGISLRHFLTRFRTQVPLYCDDNCAELKLQVRLHQRPLAEVMTTLAALVPGSGSLRIQAGYKLKMSPDAVKQRAQWWETYLQVRDAELEEIKRFWTREARLSPAQRPFDEPAKQDPHSLTLSDQRIFFNELPDDLLSHWKNRSSSLLFRLP